MNRSPADIRKFRSMIFSWWEKNRRALPWRQTSDPYRVLVSEIMLQQTQVARGLPKYREFMEKFPDVHALARAPVSEVLKAWQGMGYNRRALYLHRTAKAVVEQYNGKFPDNEHDLLSLPGVGKYTARAVLVFAMRKDIAMVETNIRQIITKFFFDGIPQKESVIQETADKLTPRGKSWEWHQALMDYGALALERDRKRSGKKAGVPFRETQRFIRGRLLAAVVERTEKEDALTAGISDVYGNPEEAVKQALAAMITDGLLCREPDGTITLPE